MKSFQDFSVFNTINPDALAPKATKPMPFPLENFDQDLATIYSMLDRLKMKLQSSEKNPINKTKARAKRIKGLKYKTKSCQKLIKDISSSCQELWY